MISVALFVLTDVLKQAKCLSIKRLFRQVVIYILDYYVRAQRNIEVNPVNAILIIREI